MSRGFYPVGVSKDELIAVLEDVLKHVKEGDSWEGFINYLIPFPPAGDPEDADFMLEARYRIGNTMGQGGMRMIGEMRDDQTETQIQSSGDEETQDNDRTQG